MLTHDEEHRLALRVFNTLRAANGEVEFAIIQANLAQEIEDIAHGGLRAVPSDQAKTAWAATKQVEARCKIAITMLRDCLSYTKELERHRLKARSRARR